MFKTEFMIFFPKLISHTVFPISVAASPSFPVAWAKNLEVILESFFHTSHPAHREILLTRQNVFRVPQSSPPVPLPPFVEPLAWTVAIVSRNNSLICTCCSTSTDKADRVILLNRSQVIWLHCSVLCKSLHFSQRTSRSSHNSHTVHIICPSALPPSLLWRCLALLSRFVTPPGTPASLVLLQLPRRAMPPGPCTGFPFSLESSSLSVCTDSSHPSGLCSDVTFSVNLNPDHSFWNSGVTHPHWLSGFPHFHHSVHFPPTTMCHLLIYCACYLLSGI